MTNNTAEKELIWVTKEQADQFKELDTAEHQSKIALKILETKSLDIQSDLQQLDDDAVRFKAACLTHKATLESVYKEQSEKMDKLIEECWDVMPKAKKNADKMAAEFAPVVEMVKNLNKEVEDLKKSASDINFYGLRDLSSAVEQIRNLDSESKEMIQFLMANFKEGK